VDPPYESDSLHARIGVFPVGRNPRSGFRRTNPQVSGISGCAIGGFTCGGSALRERFVARQDWGIPRRAEPAQRFPPHAAAGFLNLRLRDRRIHLQWIRPTGYRTPPGEEAGVLSQDEDSQSLASPVEARRRDRDLSFCCTTAGGSMMESASMHLRNRSGLSRSDANAFCMSVTTPEP
jgi:hypothetical protein